MNLSPDSTALLVVDMQNAFCHPDGSLYSEGSEEAILILQGLVEEARGSDVPVIYTRDVHTEEQFERSRHYDEFDRWGQHVLEGSWEAEIVEELEPRQEDYVVTKYTYDAFYRTELEGYLDAHGIDQLLISGTLANVCVFHTAASAGLRDLRPVIAEEATGYVDPESKEFALEQASEVFGETVSINEVEFS